MKTDFTIFFSWQSDVGRQANKGYIEAKINNAISTLKGNNTALNIHLQESTSNDTGSPEIVDVIIRKITNCDIFICDVTPISTFTNEYGTTKCIPNPNVLFELGYAVGSIGWDRIILVWNDQYGDSQYAPFDIRNHRRIHYFKNPDVRKTTNSLDLGKPIEGIVTNYNAILAKSIPSQEMKHDVKMFDKNERIFPDNDLIDSITHFYNSTNYDRYVFNKWDELYYSYNHYSSNHYINQELNSAYLLFLDNLKRTTMLAVKHFVPIEIGCTYIEPGMTSGEKDEAYKSQNYKLKDFFSIISDPDRAHEAQQEALNEISASYSPLMSSYEEYRRIVKQTLYL
jgi:hypothetical protein